jgi:hypothetical protein
MTVAHFPEGHDSRCRSCSSPVWAAQEEKGWASVPTLLLLARVGGTLRHQQRGRRGVELVHTAAGTPPLYLARCAPQARTR